MDGWPQFLQSVFVALVFSYLLAKLISKLVSSRGKKLVRPDSVEPESSKPLKRLGVSHSGISRALKSTDVDDGSIGSTNSTIGDDDDSSDDWEGDESTELDEAFTAAATFVAATAADRTAPKVSNEVQLQIYGLYKIATEGPCTTPQPSAIKMTARAKWQAWKKLGDMPPEEAMQKYIATITDLYPTWSFGSTNEHDGYSSNAPKGGSKGPIGPVFSSFACEEEPDNDLVMDAIHDFAREGDMKNLLKCIEHQDVPVNLKDSEGRTPLHWAVDRGHLNVAELLLSRKADINAKDNEGQTALHYAAICERGAIAEFLVKQSAAVDVKDNDGNSPCDLCHHLNWPWIIQQQHNILQPIELNDDDSPAAC